MQHGPASSRPSPASTKQRKQRREPEPAPKGEKGEEEGERGEKKENGTRNRTTENAGTRKRRQDSLYPVQNPIQITHSAPNKTTSTTNHGVRCAKPSGKTCRNKNRTPKEQQTSEKENFLSPFSGRKTGVFGPKKNSPKKPRTPRSEFVAKNSPAKNLRHTEL